MKVLIIGATGMLAKPVIEHFDKQGFDLRLFSRSIDNAMFPDKYEIVKGDLFNKDDLRKAIEGCNAIHINLSKTDEAMANETIVNVAKENSVQLISFLSGCTVEQENRWFPMMDNKFRAEQAIMSSGIPYLIFKATWFFESLSMMVRNGKAMMIGKQPNPYHWVAADDYARMVSIAYQKEEAKNKSFVVHGPEKHLMKDLILRYAQHIDPNIKKVSTAPIGIMKLIAFLSGKKDLKMAASLFSYFEKVPEMGNPSEANQLFGAPSITFEQWLEK